ncbi:DASS family sodium-coupled anion symporter [Kordiimonas sp. SCSIO 12610]|uniref:SLC13 family permease n=1 Tax=Kordiimonas sp. SCSIO 12610 TaxID=2829597 RepID=UPI0021088B3D|nr:DASS family sodium-coupled anion symporter [Kordiimonas sp. SCSIO 12610]UTW54625.1 DASS family sodium-coupled anion symporter [Kordiimonas sp. SCSIO 12610]
MTDVNIIDHKTSINEGDTISDDTSKKVGLIAGPLLALLIYLFFRPVGLPEEATYVAAIATLMAVWWATEATHVAVTSFLPMILFPIFGVGQMTVVASSYANPIVYLFMGGFVMAIAIEKSGLHQRAALGVFRIVGVNAKSIIGGFMVAAALISMWASNTSTALMMLPIAMSVVYVIKESMPELKSEDVNNFETSIFLGLAYGATMGGIATLVGTPPNAFMAGFMQSTYSIEVDFAKWMIIGVPLAAVMLPIIWFVLVKLLYPVRFMASERTLGHLKAKHQSLGKLSVNEQRTLILFITLVLGWLSRKPIVALTGIAELTDAAVAMTAAIAAFLIPSSKRGEALVVWEDTKRLPWGVLILFGGGLALAGAMTASGLTSWIGQQLAPLGALHIAVLVVVSCTLVIFLTELTSNTATAATFLPVMASLAIETGNNPLVFVVPVTLAASFAFMLPVATPPNAIVFSSGRVSIPRMMRAGFVLNLIGIIVLTLVATIFVPIVFG